MRSWAYWKLKANNNNNWRSITVNCNSVVNKRAELSHLVQYTDPDVIILTETHLDSTIKSSEFLPDGYRGDIRKDRNRFGGGVMLAIKSCYDVDLIELEDVDAETVWASVQAENNRKIVIGAFYRQPNHKVDQLEQLEKSLDQVTNKFKNNQNTTILLAGDFNAGDIDWDARLVRPNSSRRPVNEKVLSLTVNQYVCDYFRIIIDINALI